MQASRSGGLLLILERNRTCSLKALRAMEALMADRPD
jgi:hypothetical protein